MIVTEGYWLTVIKLSHSELLTMTDWHWLTDGTIANAIASDRIADSDWLANIDIDQQTDMIVTNLPTD